MLNWSSVGSSNKEAREGAEDAFARFSVFLPSLQKRTVMFTNKGLVCHDARGLPSGGFDPLILVSA